MKIALRLVAVIVAAGALIAGGVAGYDYVFGINDRPSIRAASPSTLTIVSTASSTTRPPRSTTTKPPTTTTTVPAVAQPAAQPMPPGNVAYGSRSDLVLAYEQRLAALHFDPGPIDGLFDQDTRYAVEALQKTYDLPRTGSIGEPERFVISAYQFPAPLTQPVEPNRVEVSLDRQYMVVYQDWQVRLITTVSTGSGRHFCGGDNGCQYAVTPPGRFELQWFYNGWKKGKLGTLYKPYYFNGGIAVHGYSSVPTYNASHGCVRIPMGIADYFHTLVTNGEPVYVVGTAADPTSRFSGPGPGPQGTVSAVGSGTTPMPTSPPPPSTAPPAAITSTTAAPTTTTSPAPSTTTRPPTTTTSPAPSTTTTRPPTTTTTHHPSTTTPTTG